MSLWTSHEATPLTRHSGHYLTSWLGIMRPCCASSTRLQAMLLKRNGRVSKTAPLYAWTKATIEDPVKKAKHLKSFALYVKGREVYTKEEADALEADLQSLVGGRGIERLSKHDTNPAHNPQPPERYRQRNVA